MRKLIASAAIATTVLGGSLLEVAPVAEAAQCYITQNRTTNPDKATFSCSGKGAVQGHIRCFYYDNGGTVHKWTNWLYAPINFTITCPSSYPFIRSAWYVNDGPF